MFLLIKIVIKLLQIRKVFTSEGGRELDQEGTQGGGVCIAVSVSVLEVGAGYTDTGFIVVKLYLYVSALFCVHVLLAWPCASLWGCKQVHAWSTSTVCQEGT